MQILALIIAVVTGLTALFTYLLGDKRKLKQLKARQYELEYLLRAALARNDTVRIADISRELKLLRAQISDIERK